MAGHFGFIHDKIDIKILILYILLRLPEPIPFDELSGLTMCDIGISYFDYAESVADLIRTEHIKLEDGGYSLTPKGERNSAAMENSLPSIVRREAQKVIYEYRTAASRNSMIKTLHEEKPDGGYNVRLSMSDGLGEVVSIEMLAMNESHAIRLENGFRKDAEKIYNALAEMLLGS